MTLQPLCPVRVQVCELRSRRGVSPTGKSLEEFIRNDRHRVLRGVVDNELHVAVSDHVSSTLVIPNLDHTELDGRALHRGLGRVFDIREDKEQEASLQRNVRPTERPTPSR